MIHFINAIFRSLRINSLGLRYSGSTLWKFGNSAASFRIYIIVFFFGLVFLTIVFRLLFITTSPYLNNNKTTQNIEIHRLDITDRNSHLLAVNLPSSSLYANPKKVIDPELSIKKTKFDGG